MQLVDPATGSDVAPHPSVLCNLCKQLAVDPLQSSCKKRHRFCKRCITADIANQESIIREQSASASQTTPVPVHPLCPACMTMRQLSGGDEIYDDLFALLHVRCPNCIDSAVVVVPYPDLAQHCIEARCTPTRYGCRCCCVYWFELVLVHVYRYW